MKMLRVSLAVTLAALFVGCGGGEREKPKVVPPPAIRSLTLSTDGGASAQTVGILMAQKRGYFEKLGIELWFRPPGSPTRPILYLTTSNEIDLAISHAPQVVISRDNDVPIVQIGSLVKQPTAAMIWLAKSKIDGIADLKGKTIAIPGLPFQKDFLEVLLRRAGLSLDDVKLRAVGYELVPALVSGEADAIFGGSWNLEGVALKARGFKPVITRIQSTGVPTYDELTLLARPRYLAKNADLVRDFLTAVARGTRAAIEDPEAAARVIAFNNAERSPRLAEAELEATLPLLSESGYMEPGQANRLAGWMHGQGLVQQEVPASTLLTNSYLESEP